MFIDDENKYVYTMHHIYVYYWWAQSLLTNLLVDWSLDGVIFVGETLGVQEWEAAICVRGFHGEFYAWINWIQMVEEGVYMVFFTMLMTPSTYLFHY